MCGIAGIYAYRDSAPPIDEAELVRVRDRMELRGPDGAGLWIADDRRFGLAHRRLAIIDVSEGGAQPMRSADGRFVISYNGEIYNHRELRRELEARGFVFRSRSDTEVLLHLYADRGERMVDALRGMFAFALWDGLERSLLLARDPFGIKPLYYADDGRTFRFASQVKALVAGNAVELAPDPAGFVGFLLMGSVPDPYTLFREIRSVAAGSMLRVRRDVGRSTSSFFEVGDALRRAQETVAREPATLAEAIRDSVGAHLVADVPVGIFLSAGIDSGTLTGVAAEACGSDLRALTLGFHEYRGTPSDEVPFACDVANHYSVPHRWECIEREDFERQVPAILAAMDQPSIDGVNSYLVSRAAARAGMKVALSGLGGDELFGGYPSFRQVPMLVRALSWTRRLTATGVAARKFMQRWIDRVASPKYSGLLEYGGTMGGGYFLRRGLFMPWELDDFFDMRMVRAGLEQLDLVGRLNATVAGLRTPRAQIAALELGWYTRNQLLRDADWAGMAHSVEIRVPLLDKTLFDAIAPSIVSSTPPTKLDFALIPRRPIPDRVRRRTKSGFTTPVREWIGAELGAKKRGLRKWARRVLPKPARTFRVLALVSDAYGGHGGIAKFNRDLIASIAAMPNCSEVVCLPRLIRREVAGVPERVRFVSGAAGAKWRFLRSLVEALRDGPYDALIIGHINLAAIGVRIARQCRIPSQLVVHGIDAWTPHNSLAVRKSLADVDRILGVSRLTLERLNDWASVERSRQRVLSNSVDLERFTPGPKPSDLRTRLGLEEKTVLMTFGRLASEERFKGFDQILDLIPSLAHDIPNIVYLICGDGPDRRRLEARCAQLGIVDRVRFAGFVDEERKPDYYRLADAYVMPSRGEGFGIVFLEALACGIPVLGSKVDGGLEALCGGAFGELVDPSQPEDIRAGILRTLGRARCVPDGLEQFSSVAFRQRVSALMRELVESMAPIAADKRGDSSATLSSTLAETLRHNPKPEIGAASVPGAD